jgi:hypothetical protein
MNVWWPIVATFFHNESTLSNSGDLHFVRSNIFTILKSITPNYVSWFLYFSKNLLINSLQRINLSLSSSSLLNLAVAIFFLFLAYWWWVKNILINIRLEQDERKDKYNKQQQIHHGRGASSICFLYSAS